MTVVEKIRKNVQKLPASFQSEVLDYVEYLLNKARQKTDHDEEKAWSDFSLASAMQELENEVAPTYTAADLKIVFS